MGCMKHYSHVLAGGMSMYQCRDREMGRADMHTYVEPVFLRLHHIFIRRGCILLALVGLRQGEKNGKIDFRDGEI